MFGKCRNIAYILLIFILVLPLIAIPSSALADNSNSDEIVLTFAGDVTIGFKNEEDYKGTMPDFLKEHDMDYSIIFSNVYDIFSNDDLTMVNLETTITDQIEHEDKTYFFRAPYDYVNILTEGSVEAVTVANNHTMDYLEQGKFDTTRTLMENDILISGENIAASTEIKGIKIGLLSYVTFQTGFNYRSALKRDIAYMKKSHDIVIVNMHWGRETEYIADYDQQQLAHQIVDLGADLVIGHHPHVIQGIEYYKDKYIVYSLGNCTFGGNSNPFNDDIILFQQRFKMTKEGVITVGAKVIPCRVSSKKYTNDFTPTPYEGGHIPRVLGRVVEYSAHMDYGLMSLPDDWIVDPYTRVEYRQDKSN